MLAVLCCVIFMATTSDMPARDRLRRCAATQVVNDKPAVLFPLALFLVLLFRLLDKFSETSGNACALPRLAKVADLLSVVVKHIRTIESPRF